MYEPPSGEVMVIVGCCVEVVVQVGASRVPFEAPVIVSTMDELTASTHENEAGVTLL